ncbi:MAG: hypothetical protein WAN89_07430 [Lawsonella sp.]|nr:hypothetical protein [Mycobacteriales bacterium]
MDKPGKKKVDPRTLARVFGESVTSLSKDECGDAAAERQSRKNWENWLNDQKPPHYNY